jgi:hypothetical protein
MCDEKKEEEKFVITPEIYQRSMEKIRIIEAEVEKQTGEKCRLMNMLSLSAIKEMKERADEYKRENPDWDKEEVHQIEPENDKVEDVTNSVEEVD